MAAPIICQGCMAWPPGIHNRHPDCFRYYLIENKHILTTAEWLAVAEVPDLLVVALDTPNKSTGAATTALRSLTGRGNTGAVMTFIYNGVWADPSIGVAAAQNGHVETLTCLIEAGAPMSTDTLAAALDHPECIRLLAERCTDILPNADLWGSVRVPSPIISDESVLMLYDCWPDETRKIFPARTLDDILERNGRTNVDVKPAKR